MMQQRGESKETSIYLRMYGNNYPIYVTQ